MREVAGRVLIDAARGVATNAHAPYSRFSVGAAVLLADGRIVTGANFENASYGLSLCAETVALATANSEGHLRDVVAIGVTGGRIESDGSIAGSALVTPCGRCRQIINEAAQLGGRDIDIYCGSADGGAFARFRASELLPHAFGPADLGLAD
ncbi:cytidine deaminase [Rhizorhabdus histidinilytica]|uniref:cytidine deaminase n=1 Tax=Rhizorhabdus histidinilytica TaxID=439228 RepID=UPI0032206A31